MLDVETMRVMLGAVSLTVLVLFYLGVYLPTRSKFSGWWALGLLCSAGASGFLLLNGTSAQVWANPFASVLSAVGVVAVWFATRSLRRATLPMWVLWVAPALVLAFALTQDPGTNIWAGNGVVFAFMALMFTAGALEMWLTWRARRVADGEMLGQALVALAVSAGAASVLAAFYIARSALYFVAGPQSQVFQDYVGTGPTTGIILVCIVAVTFSVSAIGWDQRTEEYRRRALEDDLTGLLGRSEFRTRADLSLMRAVGRGEPAVLIVADLDHFKAVNDEFGHSAGDSALLQFADALRNSLGEGECAGRLGGEEFGMVMLCDELEAKERVAAISELYASTSSVSDFELPTVSYGIAQHRNDLSATQVFERADRALYRAKDRGRNRAVVFEKDEV